MQISLFSLFSRSTNFFLNHLQKHVHQLSLVKVVHIHTTSYKLNLMEFFDKKENWGKNEVRCGRYWKVDELRIKSNQDLHKLWYVLLKEKNMLLTMEHFCKENYVLFPSPERIDKVEESMKNLETVVRERNKAYFLLEIGEDGERPGAMIHSAIGLPFYHRMSQHIVPKCMNTWFKQNFFHGYDYQESRKFLQLWQEKERRQEYAYYKRQSNEVRGLLKRFKNIDVDHLKEIYPRVDVEKIRGETRGHW